MDTGKMRGMETGLAETFNARVNEALAQMEAAKAEGGSRQSLHYTPYGVAAGIAVAFFGDAPKELADYCEAVRNWAEMGAEEWERPGLPKGYAYLKGTPEEAAEADNWDLVDERGFLYLLDWGHPRATDSYSGPIPKECQDRLKV